MISKMIYSLIAMSMLGMCSPAFASEGGSDGLRSPNNFSSAHLPSLDQTADINAPAGLGGNYLFIAGSAFTPRTSTQTVTYPGGGCAYSTGALTTSLELPDFALVDGVRLYYYSNNASANVGMFFTSYDGSGNSTDRLTGTTSFSSGYSDEYFSSATAVTIDTLSNAYVLTATMDAGAQLCGMRVFYSN